MRKTTTLVWILTPILIVIEQGIKLFINSRYLFANTEILAPWLYFKPMFNRDYSWINSLFQLGIGKTVHIILVAAVIIIIVYIYRMLIRKHKLSLLINITFSLLFAGAICSFIDKVFWDGSLDYIYLNGFFTFDLKDVFINTALGLFAIMLLTDHQGLRTSD